MTQVAIVHDVLASRSGGERVVEALAEAFPDAPIHTLIHEPTATFGSLDPDRVSSTWLNSSSWLRANYRHALPLAAMTFRTRRIDADVTICSSSGLSHNVRATGAKVVYCHTPARWLHDRANYLQGFSRTVRGVANAIGPGLERLDRKAMAGATSIIANSHHTAHEIDSIYGLDSSVVHPCSTLDLDGPCAAIEGLAPGFVLTPARPLGYKRLDVLVDAARLMPNRTFVHLGDGPHRDALRSAAPANLHVGGAVSDEQLRWAYQNAGVVVITCAEDFGLVPLEAAAHGVHTLAPDARGVLDHPLDMMTTYTFGSPLALVKALKQAPSATGQRDGSRLGRTTFIDQMRSTVRYLS